MEMIETTNMQQLVYHCPVYKSVHEGVALESYVETVL
jgi:hypothetical protein